jgi:mono/diheme cytochrome c family protein
VSSKAKRIAAAALGAVVALLVLWIASAPVRIAPEVEALVSAPGDPVAGKIVFAAGGCESCHMTPGQSEPTRLGGGLALKTPFGIFYPPNISPDEKDGIGAWSASGFANALLAGVSPQGEHLYPAFPYTSYHLMKPADARDLFAYLKTLPRIEGRAPATSLSFPFNIRRALGLWKRWYVPEIGGAKVAARVEAWPLGQYLVEGPGHCAECHSPRDMFGGIIASRRLMGGPLPEGKGKAPDITAAGLKDWSKEDIAEALSSGFTPTGDSLGSAMAAVVRNTAQLPDNYRKAIAEYLKGYKN